MVMPLIISKEKEKRRAVKRPLSAAQRMLDILESGEMTSREHSPEVRFNTRHILALAE